MKVLMTIAVLIVLGVALRLAVPHIGNSVAGGVVERDGQQQLAACPDTPNCHLDSFPIEGAPDPAIQTMVDIVTEQGGNEILTRSDQYLHVAASSRVMGFIDDVEFLVSQPADGAQPVLLVRSASRLGKSDLGVNARRVESLRSASRGRL